VRGQAAAKAFGESPQAFRQIEQRHLQALATLPECRPEYFCFARATDLKLLSELPLHELPPASGTVLCTATWLGEVRLIDNLIVP